MKRPGKLLAAATIALLCLIWGSTWAVIKIGLAGIPPLSGVAIRFSLASVVVLALALLSRVRFGRTRREVMLWVVNGLLAFTVSYGVVYWAEQWIPSGLAAVLFATYPLFVALLAHFALPEESLRRSDIVGAVTGLAGVAVIFSTDFSALGGERVAVAAAVMLLSPIAAAIGSVAVKRWGHGIHPFSLTAVPMAIAGVIMGMLALLLERERTFTFDAPSLGALAYLVVCGSVITFSLYYWLLQYLPAKRLALIAYVIPIVGVLIGALMDEPLTSRSLTGSVLVILGVAIAVHRPAVPAA